MSRRRPKAPSRFITYFQLLDAFKDAGCPVCSTVERGALRALDGLMYEQVNDPFTRERLVDSHGFCNWHAWMLPQIANSGLGVAVIYQHLLQVARDALGAAGQAAAAGRRAPGLWGRFRGTRGAPSPFLEWRSKKTPCFLCEMAHRSERDLLTTILDFIGDAEFAEAFRGSAGLCLPHLALAVDLGRDRPHLSTLLNAQAVLWRDLQWELAESTRKADYRYADEAKGREGTGWIRALGLFVGQPGLFGSERGWASADRPAVCAEPPPEAEAPEENARGEAESIEQLRFENARLTRRVDALTAQQEEERKTRLVLEFQVCKLTRDLKAMAAGVDVVEAHEKPSAVSGPVGGAEGERPPRQRGDKIR